MAHPQPLFRLFLSFQVKNRQTHYYNANFIAKNVLELIEVPNCFVWTWPCGPVKFIIENARLNRYYIIKTHV